MSTANIPDSEFDGERRPLIIPRPGTSKSQSPPPNYTDPNPENTAILIEDGNQQNIPGRNPVPPGENTDDFPKEFHKTVVVALFCAAAFFLNTISLVLTHQRLPERDPLPDIILDNIPIWDVGLEVAEIIIIFSLVSTFILMLLHKFRWIVFRRVFFIMGLLYLMRCFTMYVTVLPVASYTYYCSPKFNGTTVLKVLEAAFKVSSGFGLSIAGEHTYCGDYIYSGHTVILVTAFLVIQEYAPGHNWRWKVIHWFYWFLSVAGICLVLIARGHYTIDVLVGYYVTTRVFWIYHTLASNAIMKEYAVTNFLGRIWWYWIFRWLEGRVGGRLPPHYTIPFLDQQCSFNFEPDPDPDPVPLSTSPTASDNGQLHREKSVDTLNRPTVIGNYDETEN